MTQNDAEYDDESATEEESEVIVPEKMLVWDVLAIASNAVANTGRSFTMFFDELKVRLVAHSMYRDQQKKSRDFATDVLDDINRIPTRVE